MGTIIMGPIGSSKTYSDEIKWEEIGHDTISHIIVSYDDDGVRSIQFVYVYNGALTISKLYGPSPVGFSTRIVRLNHESEFVTGLSGEVYHDCITSLTFHTNQREHEVFHFTLDSENRSPEKIELHSGILDRREFGGFYGTYDNFSLFSIGFYVRLIPPR